MKGYTLICHIKQMVDYVGGIVPGSSPTLFSSEKIFSSTPINMKEGSVFHGRLWEFVLCEGQLRR